MVVPPGSGFCALLGLVWDGERSPPAADAAAVAGTGHRAPSLPRGSFARTGPAARYPQKLSGVPTSARRAGAVSAAFGAVTAVIGTVIPVIGAVTGAVTAVMGAVSSVIGGVTHRVSRPAPCRP